MTPERYKRYKATLDRRQPDLTVITDRVHKPHNLAAIVRTCDAVGIGEFHYTVPRAGYRSLPGTAMGSQQWVTRRSYDTVQEGVDQLKSAGFKIFAAHFSARAVNFRAVDYTQPCAILLGAEKQGVSASAAEVADEHIIIPMQGMVASYNVSVAAAIILNEAQRQRENKGLYNQVRLEQADYHRLLFKWCHPLVAEFCDKHQLPYPPLDHEGIIVEQQKWYSQVKASFKI
ncbi:tRNA (guanosine(18)-2'-O)-methyltransferase TrmH [Zooshikella ganghwensis]|uniref:tRNA (guanosine(18)-2'-O)-methyltransferase TrmH n=1 Tax=Zooshikella ganghwensis TaxID=202772 RepID=UPI00040F2545|nr:tRNA (guanosine(18)-2'-O)-methyltransferase TrmH [Zooshikella ganghwensis]